MAEIEDIAPDGPDARDLVWFAIRTNPRCERRAREGLQAKGFRTVLPLETVWSKKDRQGRKRRIDRPLFTRYLFVGMGKGSRIKLTVPAMWIVNVQGVPTEVRGHETVERVLLEPESALYEVRLTDGVESVVGIDDEPRPIPAELISRIILACVAGKFDETSPKKKGEARYSPGDKVRVQDGPFSGFIGEIAEARRDDRFLVLVKIFGRDTPADLEGCQLEAA